MARLLPITAAQFNRDVLFSPTPVVVDFYADWCGPCRILAPVLERLADRYAGQIRFLKSNVDDNPDLAERFEITAIPTLLVFQNGRLLRRYEGMADLNLLVANLDRLVGPAPVPQR